MARQRRSEQHDLALGLWSPRFGVGKGPAGSQGASLGRAVRWQGGVCPVEWNHSVTLTVACPGLLAEGVVAGLPQGPPPDGWPASSLVALLPHDTSVW